MLDVVSLFSGIEGFGLGLERTGGFRVVAQVEQDPYCLSVLERHWPHVPRFTDVREVGAHNLPRAHVVTGGFPCQDISYAGAGAGITGEQSGLWTEMLRVVRELRPRWVVVENVAALLVRGLDVVLGGLASIGYDAEWDCIPASAVGAPHRRDRIWLVAYPSRDLQAGTTPTGTERERTRPSGQSRDVAHADDGERDAGSREQRPRRRAEPRDGSEGMAHASSRGGRSLGQEGGEPRRADGLGGSGERSGADWWVTEPNVGRVAHGVPARVDRLRALGNALVPQIPEWLGYRILEWEGSVTQ